MIGKNDGVFMSGDQQRSIEREHEIFTAASLKINFLQELVDALKAAADETARQKILALLESEISQ